MNNPHRRFFSIARRACFALALAPALPCLATLSCSTASLSTGGARVAVRRDAPPPECKSLGYVVGEGGGTLGGEWISNDSLIEYAMNDLRNKAAEKGADYVRVDPPTLGSGDGTTTTATISGTAYRCNP